MADDRTTTRIKVWDLPTRLFHWVLVLTIFASWYSMKIGGLAAFSAKNFGTDPFLSDAEVHGWFGMAALILIVFRIGWGLIGSTTARFTNFIKGPGAVIGYLKASKAGEHPLHAGHNPAGGLMVVALILLIGVQGAMGLFANNDIMFDGPLMRLVGKDMSDYLTFLHKQWFYVLLGLIALHVAAVLFYKFVKKDDLITPMIVGKKDWPDAAPTPSLRFTNPLVALVLLAAAYGAIWWVVNKMAYLFL